MQSVKIFGLCVVSAIFYGIVHDLVTAHVCVEYFTIGHPPVFETDDPVILALGWGVIATWWVGAMLGIPAAIAARAGVRPKRNVREIAPMIARLLVVMAIGAAIAGVLGYFAGRTGMFILLEPLASRVPAEKHNVFLADLWAHLASYGIGFIGGIVLIVHVWMWRGRAVTEAST